MSTPNLLHLHTWRKVVSRDDQQFRGPCHGAHDGQTPCGRTRRKWSQASVTCHFLLVSTVLSCLHMVTLSKMSRKSAGSASHAETKKAARQRHRQHSGGSVSNRRRKTCGAEWESRHAAAHKLHCPTVEDCTTSGFLLLLSKHDDDTRPTCAPFATTAFRTERNFCITWAMTSLDARFIKKKRPPNAVRADSHPTCEKKTTLSRKSRDRSMCCSLLVLRASSRAST